MRRFGVPALLVSAAVALWLVALATPRPAAAAATSNCATAATPKTSLHPLAWLRRLAARATIGGPKAEVGVYYFDGWSSSCDSHFTGLLQPSYVGRQPLSGWLDNTPKTVRQQLAWARRDGVGFFVFDWYYDAALPTGSNPGLNSALHIYRTLKHHDGVGFALLYVNTPESFVIQPSGWKQEAERWVRNDFTNPAYQRVDGKPVLDILDISRFVKQAGGTAQANAELATLQSAARAAGLPGVYVVGGIWVGPSYPNTREFPSLSWVAALHVNALTQYNYPYAGGVHPGPLPYSQLVTDGEWIWRQFAATSPLPYIPVVMDGWDPRPWNEQVENTLVWFQRTPAEFEGFAHAALVWEEAHPKMRVQSKPLFLVEAWNELGEGGYMVPTVGAGNAYGRSLAQAVGLW